MQQGILVCPLLVDVSVKGSDGVVACDADKSKEGQRSCGRFWAAGKRSGSDCILSELIYFAAMTSSPQ